MTQTLAIALGGASGALMRFWVSGGIYTLFGRGFPDGTLVVNVLGSLLMGVLFVVLQERVALSPEWRAGLQIGLLGAFTTFSTFSIETLNLLQQGEQMRAMLNVVISVVACIGAAWVGLLLARQL
ncbi:MAG TPA: fluoride efflux transporter CrcB [Chromatiaceae bacterium]|nr:fluoride efflux transporter CrcB [Chromatiaceae bacterium]